MHNLFCCTLCILSWKHITIPSYHFFHYVIFFFCCFLRQINLETLCLLSDWDNIEKGFCIYLGISSCPLNPFSKGGVVKQGPSVWYVPIPRYVQVPNRYLWTYYVQGTSAEMTGNDWNILHVPWPCFNAPFSKSLFCFDFFPSSFLLATGCLLFCLLLCLLFLCRKQTLKRNFISTRPSTHQSTLFLKARSFEIKNLLFFTFLKNGLT